MLKIFSCLILSIKLCTSSINRNNVSSTIRTTNCYSTKYWIPLRETRLLLKTNNPYSGQNSSKGIGVHVAVWYDEYKFSNDIRDYIFSPTSSIFFFLSIQNVTRMRIYEPTTFSCKLYIYQLLFGRHINVKIALLFERVFRRSITYYY